ncbi:hypothetical protein [Streptomyces sp. NPDC001536]|uniref:hypothetical protein n=1 Tax=Streptomyces sp. NPDC001536 TaxID=3364583 RepID=UPI00368F49E5
MPNCIAARLRRPSDVQHYCGMYDHLRAQALDPDSSRDFITDAIESYIAVASRPQAVVGSEP